MPYWFNVDTGQVETDDDRSQDANVMGPYDSHDAAANALQHAREQHRALGPRGQGVGQRLALGRRVTGGLTSSGSTPAWADRLRPRGGGAPRRA